MRPSEQVESSLLHSVLIRWWLALGELGQPGTILRCKRRFGSKKNAVSVSHVDSVLKILRCKRRFGLTLFCY